MHEGLHKCKDFCLSCKLNLYHGNLKSIVTYVYRHNEFIADRVTECEHWSAKIHTKKLHGHACVFPSSPAWTHWSLPLIWSMGNLLYLILQLLNGQLCSWSSVVLAHILARGSKYYVFSLCMYPLKHLHYITIITTGPDWGPSWQKIAHEIISCSQIYFYELFLLYFHGYILTYCMALGTFVNYYPRLQRSAQWNHSLLLCYYELNYTQD